MAGVGIRVEIDDTEIGRALRRLRQVTGNLRPTLDAIGRKLVVSTEERFETGTDPEGRRWKPSVAVAAGRKTLHGPGYPRLARSISHSADDDEVAVGTNVHYAEYHQRGTAPYVIRARPGGALHWRGARHPVRSVNHPGLVARRFIGLSRQDDAAVLGAVQRDLVRAWGVRGTV